MGEYITVQQIRDEGITIAIAPDSKVLNYIRTWQEILERACRNWFEARLLTVQLNGTDSDTLFLGVPIISLTHLKINNSDTALESTYYKVYSEKGSPDYRRNPKISLVSEELRDVFTAPLTTGRLKFYKGKKNQEIKATFGFIEPDIAASGSIKFVGKHNLVDGETFVLNDGTTTVTFHFDVSGTYTPVGGYDATDIRVNVSSDTSADEVATTAKTAINGSTLDITGGTINLGEGLLRLENNVGGTDGNQAISETVSNSSFIVYGMTGGGVPYAIIRALTKLVIEKLTNPIYDPGGTVSPSASATGAILEEKTDGHAIKYQSAGGGFSERRPGLTGITQDPEILDIIVMYRAPRGLAAPAGWSFN